MTIRLDKTNIIKYLKTFKESQIRISKHSNLKRKERLLTCEDIYRFILHETPYLIKQEGTKEFELTYKYDDEHCFFIVIAIKDKFINIVTQYKYNKRKFKK